MKQIAARKGLLQERAVRLGIGGAVALFAIYFLILTVLQSFQHAVQQFSQIWYWIVLLAAGFGVQLGLFSHVRATIRSRTSGETAEVVAAGGVSTGSMIACCAHHIVDLLPILGFSALAVFLVKYQLPFILVGVFTNLVGITLMLNIIQKHGSYPKRGVVGRLFVRDIRSVRNLAIAVGVLVVSTSFFLSPSTATNIDGTKATAGQAGEGTGQPDGGSTQEMPGMAPTEPGTAPTEPAAAPAAGLAVQKSDENGVVVSVRPVELRPTVPAKFDISLETHEGSLDSDFTKDAVLEDDKGTVYAASAWDGPGPGGHHRQGTLSFEKLAAGAKTVTLTLKNVGGVRKRAFSWTVQ